MRSSDLSSAAQAWSVSGNRVVEHFGATYGVCAGPLSAFVSIELVRGDEAYSPFPTLKEAGNGIAIQANLDAYRNEWLDIFESVDGIDQDQARNLYLGMGVSWAELAFTAYGARAEREIDGRGKAMKRAVKIMSKLKDQGALVKHALELEDAGFVNASLLTTEIGDAQVQTINRIRYGLGASYIAEGIPAEVRERVTCTFRERFADYVNRMGDDLITFMGAFALDKTIEPDKYKAHGLVKAFPEFLFAGTLPMELTDIIK